LAGHGGPHGEELDGIRGHGDGRVRRIAQRIRRDLGLPVVVDYDVSLQILRSVKTGNADAPALLRWPDEQAASWPVCPSNKTSLFCFFIQFKTFLKKIFCFCIDFKTIKNVYFVLV
jgi:hypothetical protein